MKWPTLSPNSNDCIGIGDEDRLRKTTAATKIHPHTTHRVRYSSLQIAFTGRIIQANSYVLLSSIVGKAFFTGKAPPGTTANPRLPAGRNRPPRRCRFSAFHQINNIVFLQGVQYPINISADLVLVLRILIAKHAEDFAYGDTLRA